MRKLLLLFLLFAAPLAAQNPTAVSGTITDPNGVAYYPATVTACLTPVTTDPIVNGQHVNQQIGSNYCVPLANTSPTGFFSLSLFPNSAITPAATQWRFTVTTLGAAPPAGKGPQTFQSSITISGSSQDVGATLTAASLALLNSGATASSAQGIDPTQAQYAGGVKSNGKVCFGSVSTITITNASTTVVCSTANFTVLDVGKEIYGTNGCCGVALSYQGVLVLPRGTIVSITNSTTVVVTVAATSGCTGAGCILVWGTNDDAAWTSAETAWQSGTGKCSAIQAPVGLSLISLPHFNSTGSGCGGAEPELDFTGAIIGYGAGASVLAIEPNFNFAGCTFGLGSVGCFFSDVEMVVKDVGLWGAGYGNTGTNAKVMVNPGVGSTLFQVGLIAFGGSDVSLIGIQMAAAFRGYYIICDGMGRTCGSATGTGSTNQAFCFGCFFGDTLGPYLNINASNNYVSYGGQYGTTGGTVGINQAGNYYGFGEFLFTCSQIANATAIFMSNFANAETWLDGSSFNCTSTTSNGIFMNASTQKLHLANGTKIGGTTAAINRSAGVVYMSDDTILAGTIGTSLRPALATSGNGTIAVSGTGLSRNELGMFTLTAGTTSGATPTVTITFAGTPLGPGGGAPRCDLSLLNGTVDGVTFSGTWNARFSQAISALSTTAVTYTIDNNAVALTNGSTYGGQYSCRFS